MNTPKPNLEVNSSFHSSTSPALWTLNQAILAILIWLLLEMVFNMSAQGVYQLIGETHWFQEAAFVAFYVPAITIASQLITLIYWQAWLSYFALMRQKSFNTIRNAIGLYSIGFKNFLRLLSVTVGCLLLTAVFIGWLQSHGEQCEFNPAEALKNKAKSDANKAKSDAKKIKDDSKTDKIEKKKTSAS